MIRSWLYLMLSGGIWLVEGFLFSYFLRFDGWQAGLMALFYVSLFAVACRQFSRAVHRVSETPGEFPAWRFVSLMPMLVVTLGSFASLPILILIVVAGSVLGL